MTKVSLTSDDVVKVAKLANLTLSSEELKKFPEQFTKTLEVVDELNEIDTNGVKLTSQVISLSNVTREDVIDEERMFSQTEALMNAKKTDKGFFVVKQVVSKDE